MKTVLIVITALMTYAAIAKAGPTINGIEFERPVEDLPIKTELISSAPIAGPFSAEEGEGMARSARIEKGRKARHESETNTDYCFSLMRDEAQEGECSATFFAEDASCEQEDATGCFENRWFRKKVGRLGFKVVKREVPTSDEDDRCAAITVYWCRDLRKHR